MTMIQSNYVELHARSAFSFLEGVSVPEELIAAAAELGMPAMALLDRDGVYGAPRFHLAAAKQGIKAHVGAEITVSSLKFQISSKSQVSGLKSQVSDYEPETWDLRLGTFSLPVLVRNRTGYQNLCRLVTLMKLRVPKHGTPGECAVSPAELAAHADGLVCLTSTETGPLKRNGKTGTRGERETQRTIEWLLQVFGKGNVYAELQS